MHDIVEALLVKQRGVAERPTRANDRSSRTRKYFFIMCVAFAAIATASGVWLRPATAPDQVRASTSSGDGRSANQVFSAEAVEFYRAGMRAQREGSKGVALAKFKKATELDPAYAAAHLRWFITHGFVALESREHFAKAAQHRQSLDIKDQALLAAIEPWTRLPPDAREVDRRLVDIAKAFPSDAVIKFFISKYRYLSVDDQGAIDAATEALQLDAGFGDALRIRGLSRIRLHQFADGISDFKKCLASSPSATWCSRHLFDLYVNEGQCVEAEATCRSLVALDPDNPEWRQNLAYTLYAVGAPTAAIETALKNAYERMPADRARIDDLMDHTRLRIVEGDANGADSLSREWVDAAIPSAEDDDHFTSVNGRGRFLIEVGRAEDARALVNEYLRRREGLVHDVFDVETLFFAEQLKYLAGGLTRDQYELSRERWVAAENQRLGNEPPITWSWAYAASVTNPSQARQALELLPRYGGVPDAITRKLADDAWIGTTYLFAGEVETAVEYLGRATRSCKAVKHPFALMLAHYQLGRAMELLGDTSKACSRYRAITERWGAEGGRFEVGRAAAKRIQALECPRRGR
jgi:tetratricopeptide (TPR) repeat protein